MQHVAPAGSLLTPHAGEAGCVLLTLALIKCSDPSGASTNQTYNLISHLPRRQNSSPAPSYPVRDKISSGSPIAMAISMSLAQPSLQSSTRLQQFKAARRPAARSAVQCIAQQHPQAHQRKVQIHALNHCLEEHQNNLCSGRCLLAKTARAPQVCSEHERLPWAAIVAYRTTESAAHCSIAILRSWPPGPGMVARYPQACQKLACSELHIILHFWRSADNCHRDVAGRLGSRRLSNQRCPGACGHGSTGGYGARRGEIADVHPPTVAAVGSLMLLRARTAVAFHYKAHVFALILLDSCLPKCALFTCHCLAASVAKFMVSLRSAHCFPVKGPCCPQRLVWPATPRPLMR